MGLHILGCACDIPAHSYQYSFNPNPDWSAFYAPQPEIHAYLQGTAEKYGVLRYVKLSHKVESCRWSEDRKKWSQQLIVKKSQAGINVAIGSSQSNGRIQMRLSKTTPIS